MHGQAEISYCSQELEDEADIPLPGEPLQTQVSLPAKSWYDGAADAASVMASSPYAQMIYWGEALVRGSATLRLCQPKPHRPNGHSVNNIELISSALVVRMCVPASIAPYSGTFHTPKNWRHVVLQGRPLGV